MKVGKEGAKAHRHSETEFNKEIFHVLLVDATLKAVQALQETGQQGKELLVQQLVASCGGEGSKAEGRGVEGGRRVGERGKVEGREKSKGEGRGVEGGRKGE